MVTLAAEFLKRWRQPALTTHDVDLAERWAIDTVNGAHSMVTVQGAWRARIVNGTLYAKLLFSRRTWAERASTLNLLRMVAHSLPNVDVVFVHSDQDASPRLGWPCNDRRHGCAERQVIVLTNAFSGAAHGQPNRSNWLRASLPVPEFTFAGWGPAQPPWCTLSASLRNASDSQAWATRDDRAFFAGSLTNGRFRQRLAKLLSEPSVRADLFVHDARSRFFTFAPRAKSQSAPSSSERRAERLPLHTACGFRYCLSIPGFGYSSRLRSLLACGCVVIHVRSADKEYFTPLLQHGVHWMEINRVDQLHSTLKQLRANESWARSIAAAGSNFAARELNHGAVLNYFRALIHSVAVRMSDPPVTVANARAEQRRQNFTRVTTAADVGDVVRLHPRCEEGGRRPLAVASPGTQTMARRCCTKSKMWLCCRGHDCPVPLERVCGTL